MAGEKLRKGNPTITDLSNPNRPAKIGILLKVALNTNNI
jgi:hypothetical protein